ncbi:hypothetical protein [Erythrobacter sp.]|jgi:hypothetical protein|uniref:hypothetical protein n=1 Tax=Erythrobacter sp. TaxID=1042 RepID=UPI002EC7FD5B|nr:hypothetical protein [Erythrobacter sp.]
MIGRIVWWALIATVALGTAALQLDRRSFESPALATAIPSPLRSIALQVGAREALRAGDADLALERSRNLVRQRPLPAEHLRLLAQAQFASGDLVGGSQTIQAAAQRGWRDRASQEAMLRLAIAGGADEEAVRRYTALLLLSPESSDMLRALGPTLFDNDAQLARATMIDLLRASPRWHAPFLQRGVQLLPPQTFVDIITGALADAAPMPCDIIERAARATAARNEAAGERLTLFAAERCG